MTRTAVVQENQEILVLLESEAARNIEPEYELDGGFISSACLHSHVMIHVLPRGLCHSAFPAPDVRDLI